MKNSLYNQGSDSKVARSNLRMANDSKNVSTKLPDSNKAATGFSASKYISKNMDDVIKAHTYSGFGTSTRKEIDIDARSNHSIMEDDESDFNDQLDLIADLYDEEFGAEDQGPVVFGEVPDMITGHLEIEFAP